MAREKFFGRYIMTNSLLNENVRTSQSAPSIGSDGAEMCVSPKFPGSAGEEQILAPLYRAIDLKKVATEKSRDGGSLGGLVDFGKMEEHRTHG